MKKWQLWILTHGLALNEDDGWCFAVGLVVADPSPGVNCHLVRGLLHQFDLSHAVRHICRGLPGLGSHRPVLHAVLLYLPIPQLLWDRLWKIDIKV